MTSIEMQAFGGTPNEWNSLVASMPGAHLLQTWEWSQVKAGYGWQALPFVWRGAAAEHAAVNEPAAAGKIVAAAMILRRRALSRGFARRLCILYVPKGPLLQSDADDVRAQVLRGIEELGRREGAILVKIDPDVQLGRGYAEVTSTASEPIGGAWLEMLTSRGWRFSESQVQFRNSVWIDLGGSSEDLLGRMKQKTRYNIRLAERKGVAIRAGTAADTKALYRIYAETANRDGFVIRSEDYYRTVWSTFSRESHSLSEPAAEALVAEVDGEPIAALWLFRFAGRAYYLYGMSTAAHREKMPNYLLQWRAIQRSKDLGCAVYDLWGAPDRPQASDAMWGVYRFKEGLGGYVVRTLGAWDYPSGGMWYGVYTQMVPRLLDLMRLRGRQQTSDTIVGA